MDTMNWINKWTSHIVVVRSRVEKYIESWIFGFNGIYKGSFKEIVILKSESKCGIWRRCVGHEEHRKKFCEGTDREFKLADRNKVFFFREGFSIIDSLKMLEIKENIWHGQVIHDIIKLDTGGKFYSVGMNIIVYHVLGGMWIISKEYYFGDMVLQLGFYLYVGSHRYTTSKVPKGGEVLLLGYILLNGISYCIRLWK